MFQFSLCVPVLLSSKVFSRGHKYAEYMQHRLASDVFYPMKRKDAHEGLSMMQKREF